MQNKKAILFSHYAVIIFVSVTFLCLCVEAGVVKFSLYPLILHLAKKLLNKFENRSFMTKKTSVFNSRAFKCVFLKFFQSFYCYNFFKKTVMHFSNIYLTNWEK